ncbi:MAG: tRNA guanosine(34) transglycosylase Tgt [Candidatus Diapherotrites archaeon]|nr:tRNA guanosine(34) transglycosylase Tgt [Candidatus Diapherotrites archaeon]
MNFNPFFQDSKTSARSGFLKTAHGRVQTPFFMPVETKAAAKFVSQEELDKMGVECFISNALLLHFKPGLEIVKKAGGLHKFLNWEKSIFTDSGGFQVIDEHFLLRINDAGAEFRDPFSGKRECITPEKAIAIQNSLGADVIMCLDDQPHFGRSKDSIAQAVKRTLLWAEKCKKAHSNKRQQLFGICQGGLHSDLRKKSIEGLLKIDFDGIAIGGFGIGEENAQMMKVVEKCVSLIPEEKPVYLMGIGSPKELVEGISAGVDVFDSCFPTRVGRHGMVFTRKGALRLEKAQFAKDFKQLDADCDCFVCRNYSRAYIHHLFKLKEPSGMRYLSHHNLHFLQRLVQEARQNIKENSFLKFRNQFLKNYSKKLL